MPTDTPSCRSLDQPLADAVSRDPKYFQYYVIDGYIVSGNLEVEDNAFRLDALGLRIISDGITRWTLDDEAREAVVETVQKEDVTANPALLIGHYADYAQDLVVNASGKDFLDVTLVMDNTTRARFFLKDIVFEDPKGKSDFSLEEKSLPKDYLVTDLR